MIHSHHSFASTGYHIGSGHSGGGGFAKGPESVQTFDWCVITDDFMRKSGV